MRHFFVVSLLYLSFSIQAQDVRDLVRFSQTQVFGSARFEAMAGSFGALGADLSTSAINPAGYGRYSSSTFGAALGHTYTNNASTFNNQVTNRSANAFRLNNLGLVFANDISQRNKGFLFQQFGFSYNRIENFKDKIAYSGEQYFSLLDHFAGTAGGLSIDDMYSSLAFTSALAWDTYAIDPDGSGGYYPRLDPDARVFHRRSVDTKGGISEYNFNFSGNYMNKLYIGGNWGYRTAKYEETYIHNEVISNSPVSSLDSFQYEYHLKTKGSGNNFKIGAIYLPIESLRLGISIHSPTFFEFTDDYNADMVAYHKDTTYRTPLEYKPVGKYKYRLRTPAKFVGSFGYIFGTRGCINIDAEWVNYNWAHLLTTSDESYAPYNYTPINTQAKEQVRSVVNVRIGGEMVFQSQYFIRAGYAYYPSAYKLETGRVKGVQIYSCGFGFK